MSIPPSLDTLHTLSSYLPHPLAERLLLQPEHPLIGESQRFKGVVLFADISGFTPLAEALRHIGPQGAEELTQAINGFFAPLIALSDHWGGTVGKFAGDAMTVLFRGRQAAWRALSAASAMQEKAKELEYLVTRAGEYRLQIKFGLAYGPVLQTICGGPGRAEFVFAGPPLDQAAEAEHHAAAGQVILHTSLQNALGKTACHLLPLGQKFSCLQNLPLSAPACPPPPLPAPKERETAAQALRPFLPPPVYERLLEGQALFVNENRQAHILFVNFSGLDYTHKKAAVHLATYSARLVQIAAHYGGWLVSLDCGDKGSKALLAFGAPLAHEDDGERALLCALDLQALVNEFDFIQTTRIGVNCGNCFTGNIGATSRQEYTVMGDAVNLAARLMQQATPGQTLVSQEVAITQHRRFTWNTLPPLKVKGKLKPVAVLELTGLAERCPICLQEPQYSLPMVGRNAELAQIEGHVRQLIQARQGSAVCVMGEAGLGKSRMIAELIRRALAAGCVGFGGEGVSHASSAPYLAWRAPLAGLLGLDQTQSHAAQIENAHQTLVAIDPALALRLPLLGPVLGLEIIDTPLTQHFTSDLRRQSLFALVSDLVRHIARQTPLLLVIENAHWLDDLSRQLLHYLARQVDELPALLIVTARPPLVGEETSFWPASLGSQASEIHLAPFTPQESAELIRLKLARSDLPDNLLIEIEDRAQGNPFFIDEFINLLQAQHIDLDDSAMRRDLQVPASLQMLIASRIDQLEEDEKMTLRIASVIGRLFRSRWLEAIYPGELRGDLLKNTLDRLSEADLTQLGTPEPELEYLFKHALTQEVAHNMLAFSVRRTLHGRLASYLENTYASELDAWHPILAFHYQQAEQPAKEFLYASLSARQVANQAGTTQALHFYERAIDLHEQHGLGQPDEIFDLYCEHLEQGIIAGQAGNLRQEAARLANLAAALDAPRQVRALIMQSAAETYGTTPDMPAAIQFLEAALALAEKSGDQRGRLEVLRDRGMLCFNTGDYLQARRLLALVVDQASEADWLLASVSVRALGWVAYDEFDLAQTERYWLHGLSLARQHVSLPEETIHLCNLGALYMTQGKYEEALATLHHALDMTRRLGRKVTEASTQNFLADAWQVLGQYERALECGRQACMLGRQVDSHHPIAYGDYQIALALFEMRRQPEKVEELCQQAIEITRAAQDIELLAYPLHLLGRVRHRAGDYPAAETLFNEAIELRSQIGQSPTIAETLGDMGQMYLEWGRAEQARNCAETLWNLLFSQSGASVEEPHILAICAHLLQAAGETQRAEHALAKGRALLQERTAAITSPDMRRSYLENIAMHRKLWDGINNSGG